MELQYHGANCVSITTKKARVVIDDNLKELGLKPVINAETIAVYTFPPAEPPKARLVFSDPGEYEASEVSVFGIPARSHMDEAGKHSATVYKIESGDIKIAVAGHIHPDMSEDDLEELGAVDILIIPVGGNGYTLDAVGALSIIKKVEPKIVIPTHYEDSKISYPVPQQPLAEALKGLAMDPKETLQKFRPKPTDLSDTVQLVILERV